MRKVKKCGLQSEDLMLENRSVQPEKCQRSVTAYTIITMINLRLKTSKESFRNLEKLKAWKKAEMLYGMFYYNKLLFQMTIKL